MKKYEGNISKSLLSLFVSDIGSEEFFSYVGHSVTLEQAISVLGVISPDFVEVDGHVFWLSNARKFHQTDDFKGLVEDESGVLKKSLLRKDVERYKNILSINQFFSRWEDTSTRPVYMIGLSEENYRLSHVFAEQLVKHWSRALSECFSDRKFQFEIADDILDEYGVCLTFWQL